jgi:tetratricopeptide (TPR) repeat protein
MSAKSSHTLLELCYLLRSVRTPLNLCASTTRVAEVDKASLKYALRALKAVVRRITAALMQTSVDEKAFNQYCDSSSLQGDCSRVEVLLHQLEAVIRRAGLSGGIYDEIAGSQLRLMTTQWEQPLVFMPDRSLLYIPRVHDMARLEAGVIPGPRISFTCVVSRQSLGSVGKSQLVNEFCYKGAEKGVFGVVAWIDAALSSTCASSFRYFARRIQAVDPEFSVHTASIEEMSSDDMIAAVVGWLQRLKYPWLLIFDGVADASCLSSKWIPKRGKGCVVITTHTSQLEDIRPKISATPSVIDVSCLTPEEMTEMADVVLNADDLGSYAASDVAQLVDLFDGHPLEFTQALGALSLCRTRLPGHFGSISSYLSALEAGAAAAPAEERRGAIVSATLARVMDVAERVGATHDRAIVDLLSLFAYTQNTDVDLRLMAEWFNSKKCSFNIRVVPDGFVILDSGVATLSKISRQSKLDVIVSCDTPREVLPGGRIKSSWKLQKTYLELQTFFDEMKLNSSTVSALSFPGTDSSDYELGDDFADKFSVSVEKLNECFRSLCADESWMLSSLERDVQLFLGAHPDGSIDNDLHKKLESYLDSLVSLGIVSFRHTMGFIEKISQRVSCSLCGDYQAAVLSLIRSSGQEDEVLDRLHALLVAELDFALAASNSSGPLETVLSHCARAAAHPRPTKIYFELITRALEAAQSLCLHHDSWRLAQAAVALAEYKQFGLAGTEVEVDLNLKAADALVKIGRSDQVFPFLVKAFEVAESLADNRKCASISIEHANACLSLGNYEDAEGYLMRALEKWQVCVHEDKYLDLASCLQQMGILYRLLGKVEKSLEFDNTALDILLSAYGPSHPTVLAAQHSVGTLFMRLGMLDMAISVLRKGLAAIEAHRSRAEDAKPLLRHQSVWLLHVAMADCLCNRQRHQEAEVVLNDALDLLMFAHDNTPHESVSTVLTKLASVQADQGKHEQALKTQRDALDMMRWIYGANDPRVAQWMNIIGTHLRVMGRLAEAEGYFKGALDILQKNPDNNTTLVLANYAGMLRSQGKAKEARQAAERSLEILMNIGDPMELDMESALDLAGSMILVGELMLEQGQMDTAAQVLEGALAVRLKHLGDRHAGVAECLERLAELHRVNGNITEMEACREKSRFIYLSLGILDKVKPYRTSSLPVAEQQRQRDDDEREAAANEASATDDAAREKREQTTDEYLKMQEDVSALLLSDSYVTMCIKRLCVMMCR